MRPHSDALREARRELAAVVRDLRRSQHRLLAIARIVHRDPLCRATARRIESGDEWADSVPYSLETACISIAKDYITKDVIDPLVREGLRRTAPYCGRKERSNRAMHRRIKRELHAENAA